MLSVKWQRNTVAVSEYQLCFIYWLWLKLAQGRKGGVQRQISDCWFWQVKGRAAFIQEWIQGHHWGWKCSVSPCLWFWKGQPYLYLPHSLYPSERLLSWSLPVLWNKKWSLSSRTEWELHRVFSDWPGTGRFPVSGTQGMSQRPRLNDWHVLECTYSAMFRLSNSRQKRDAGWTKRWVIPFLKFKLNCLPSILKWNLDKGSGNWNFSSSPTGEKDS